MLLFAYKILFISIPSYVFKFATANTKNMNPTFELAIKYSKKKKKKLEKK